MELSELTVRPAIALPKDFDGVLFIELTKSFPVCIIRHLESTLINALPNASIVFLDAGMRLAAGSAREPLTKEQDQAAFDRLPNRLKNVLGAKGIETMEGLAALGRREVKLMRSIGETSLIEAEHGMKTVGLWWADNGKAHDR